MVGGANESAKKARKGLGVLGSRSKGYLSKKKVLAGEPYEPEEKEFEAVKEKEFDLILWGRTSGWQHDMILQEDLRKLIYDLTLQVNGSTKHNYALNGDLLGNLPSADYWMVPNYL